MCHYAMTSYRLKGHSSDDEGKNGKITDLTFADIFQITIHSRLDCGLCLLVCHSLWEITQTMEEDAMSEILLSTVGLWFGAIAFSPWVSVFPGTWTRISIHGPAQFGSFPFIFFLLFYSEGVPWEAMYYESFLLSYYGMPPEAQTFNNVPNWIGNLKVSSDCVWRMVFLFS